MPDTTKFAEATHTRLGKIIFASFTLIIWAIAISIQFAEPFSFKARLTDALVIGGGVPILGILGVELVRKVRPSNIFTAVNLYIVGMFGVGLFLVLARLTWLIYREHNGHPDWLRDLATLWLSQIPVFSFVLYGGWEAVDGDIRRKAYFWWWGVVGGVVALLLLLSVWVRG